MTAEQLMEGANTSVATAAAVSHIVLASRAYSRDEERKMNQTFARLASSGGSGGSAESGTAAPVSKYRVAHSMVPFGGRDEVKRADKVVAEKLKEIFQPYLPKYEEIDEPQMMDFDNENN